MLYNVCDSQNKREKKTNGFIHKLFCKENDNENTMSLNLLHVIKWLRQNQINSLQTKQIYKNVTLVWWIWFILWSIYLGQKPMFSMLNSFWGGKGLELCFRCTWFDLVNLMVAIKALTIKQYSSFCMVISHITLIWGRNGLLPWCIAVNISEEAT